MLTTTFERFAELARPFAEVDGTPLAPAWPKIAALLQNRVEVLGECAGMIGFRKELPKFELELFRHKKSKSDEDNARTDLPEIRRILAGLESWTAESIGNALTAFAEEREVKAGRPMWQARIAVSGCAVTPGGPGEIMEILGREESLRRLDAAVARLTE